MSDLNRALGDIRDIRRQMAQTTEFRGYGPATLATTALFAAAAAFIQSRTLHDPAAHPLHFCILWGFTVFLSATLIAVQTLNRARRLHSALADDMLQMAVEQFLPAGAAGGLVTLALLTSGANVSWTFPGLWQIIYSLGIFSSCRFLPRPLMAAGALYLFTGLACLSVGDARTLAPWVMGTACTAGQLLIAVLLYVTVENKPDES